MKKKQSTNESAMGLLVFYKGVMNKRSVAFSTVTGCRIRSCFSKPIYDLCILCTYFVYTYLLYHHHHYPSLGDMSFAVNSLCSVVETVERKDGQ